MSELKIINTKGYNSELDEVCKNETDIFIKTKLTRRVTFGEYQFEPKNGFQTDNEYYSDAINLDECEVYYLQQPTLNENQQIVLKEIKDISQECDYNLLGIIWVLGQRAKHDTDISRFTNNEILQVLQAFASWALEQEER